MTNSVQLNQLSVLQRDVYEGRGSSVGLHRVTDRSGRVGLWKEYKDDVIATMDAAQLTALVQWPGTLSPRDRDRILPQLAMPYSVVRAGQRAVGVVMPEAPGDYYYRDRRGRVRPRTIDMLSNNRRSAGRSPFFEPPHRLALLGRLLLLVSDLHDAGVVVGDLQPQNILVSGDLLHPSVLVLDCDSFWLHGRHAFGPPADPATWRSPYLGTSFTSQTDLFKLALLVTRCLQEDNREWYPKRDILRQYMPTHQVERIEGLLEKEVSVSAQQLRGLAVNWRSRIGPGGTMYNATDDFMHAPWVPPAQDDPPWGTAEPADLSEPTAPAQWMPPPASAPASIPVPAAPFSGQPAPVVAPIADDVLVPQPERPPRRVLSWILLAVVVGVVVIASLAGGGR